MIFHPYTLANPSLLSSHLTLHAGGQPLHSPRQPPHHGDGGNPLHSRANSFTSPPPSVDEVADIEGGGQRPEGKEINALKEEMKGLKEEINALHIDLLNVWNRL